MFIIREDLKRLGAMTEAERNAGIPPMLKWVEGIAEGANYLWGEPLDTTGRYIRKDQVLTDGPFIEAKEGVSGVIIIAAENLEQASSIAQMCPLVLNGTGVVEVRPLMNVPPEMLVKNKNG